MRDRRYLAAGAVLLALTGALQAAARSINGFSTWYAHSVYAAIVGIVGGIFGVFPFSVVEVLLYLLILGCIVYAARFWREPKRLASRTVFLAGILLFLYTCNCGINYYAASFSGYVGLQTGKYTKEELKELCAYLVERVNETAGEEEYGKAHAGEYGWAQDGEYGGEYDGEYGEGYDGAHGGKYDRSWRREGVRAMQRAGEEFSVLGGFYPQPKEVAISWILSVQQLCGIYSPFTVEANFNGDMTDYNIPHTICHELSHLKGFMREDEANFIGYLACIGSESRAFRYSGYLTGWVYAGNALARADVDAYIELAQKLCDQARSDLAANNAFWDRYEGRVAEVSNQMNDVYLKMNDQSDGVKSYGRMVDLMLEYYQKR